MSFQTISTPFINLGIPVFPLSPKTKIPLSGLAWLTEATTDAKKIASWSKQNPEYNVALVANGDFCFLEFDITDGFKKAAKQFGKEIPETRTQKSGKGFGHYIFKSNERSRFIGNRSANIREACTCKEQDNRTCFKPDCQAGGNHHHHEWFSFRADNKYLVGAGSTHPNGKQYECTLDIEPIPVPDWVLDFVSSETKPATPRPNIKDMIEVCDDFDFDDLMDFNHIGILYENSSDYHVVDACPGTGCRHTNSTETGFYFDGTHLGWSCFAQDCPCCGIGIGKMIKFLNEQSRERGEGAYTGPIWTTEEDYQEQEDSLYDDDNIDFDEDLPDDEPIVPVVLAPIESATVAGGVSAADLDFILNSDHINNEEEFKAAKAKLQKPKVENICYDDHDPLLAFKPVPRQTLEEALVVHEELKELRKKIFDRELKEELAEQQKQQFGEEKKDKDILKALVSKDRDDGTRISLIACYASEVTMVKLDWLWEGKIPAGKIVLFTGKPGGGKSTACADIVARVTTGKNWPDGKINTMGPKKVLMACAEDDYADTVVPRLTAAGADLTKVLLIPMMLEQGKQKKDKDGEAVGKRSRKRLTLDLKNHAKLLIELAQREPDIALLVLDPITSYFGKADQNKDSEIRPLMDELKRVCEKSGISFIGLIHGNKRSDVDSLQKILGASSIVGSARAVWGFTIDPEDKDKRSMAYIKGNLTKDTKGMEYSLGSVDVLLPDGTMASIGKTIWGDEIDMSADEILDAERDKAREKRNGEGKTDLCAVIINSMLPSPQSKIMEAAAKEGISEKSVYRTKKQLMIESKKHANEWWWYLPGTKNKPLEPKHVGTDMSDLD